jgi:transketolase
MSTATRDAYRDLLAALLPTDPRLYCLDSDTGLFTGVDFGPAAGRYLNLGIAEHTLMGTAAGLAAGGKLPFVNTMATFATTRALEALKIDVAYAGLPVRVVATHGGLSAGHLGPTHHCLEDLAIMRTLPGFTVVVPADADATVRAVRQSLDLPGPLYLRLGRKPTPPLHPGAQAPAAGTAQVPQPPGVGTAQLPQPPGVGTARLPQPPGVGTAPVVAPPSIGTAQRLRDGSDIAVLACGPHPVHAALRAADDLAARGIEATVLNVHTLKPLDVEAIVAAAERTGAVITVEEHQTAGGLGGAVAETLAEHRPARVVRIGMPDTFAAVVGDHDHLLDHYGITDAEIVKTTLALLGSMEVRVP